MEKENLQMQERSDKVSQVEDRVLKTAAQFFGEDLFPYVGVQGEIDRVAPTEHIHLEMRRLERVWKFIPAICTSHFAAYLSPIQSA